MLLHLERVESKEEAKSTKLVEKGKVEELHFVWSKESDRIVENDNDLEMLEGLLNHIKILNIIGNLNPF